MNFSGLANTLLHLPSKPPFIYGTAWKKDRTTTLVKEALEAGFRAVDTAAQPRHYREDLVGDSLRQAYQDGRIKREDLFIQTKFTSPGGQDHTNMPYNPLDPLQTQLTTSLKSSFFHLRPLSDPSSEENTYIDCLLLHSPLPTLAETLSAWAHLSTYVPRRIRSLGISNTDLETLKAVYDQGGDVKPAVVQNRFYPRTRHDVDLRRFCADKGIVYESFWTLTGNPALAKSDVVDGLAREAGVQKEVAMYALVMGLGIAVLNGTTNKGRMEADLRDVERVRNWGNVYREKWELYLAEFRKMIEERESGE